MKKILILLSLGGLFGNLLFGQDDPFESNRALEARENIEIPAKFKSAKSVTLQIEENSKLGIGILIINNLENSIKFSGHCLSAPSYRIQFLSKGKWIDKKDFFVCGTGLYNPELPSLRACRFFVATPQENKLAFRVGINFEEQPNGTEKPVTVTVWTDTIQPKHG
jgi:hypothetical protein